MPPRQRTPLLLLIACSCFFILCAFLYVRPYIAAAVGPYKPVHDPYQDEQVSCFHLYLAAQ